MKDNIMTMQRKYDTYRNFQFCINNKINIFCTYHNEELIEKYHLEERDNIVLFNSSNIGYDGVCINHLNGFLSETTTLLYPYLNNLHSDYIGFQHYRRSYNTHFNNEIFDKLDDGFIEYFDFSAPIHVIHNKYGHLHYNTPYKNIENHCLFWSMDKCGIMDDLIEFLETQYPQYLKSENEIHDFYSAGLFVCNWNMYTELAKFIYDYIKFVNDKYKLEWNEQKWFDHVCNKFLVYNQVHHIHTQKEYSLVIEPDGNIWYDLPLWGTKGWITQSYINPSECSKLYRLYGYNTEFLVSLFIFNHKHFIDIDNMSIFIEEK